MAGCSVARITAVHIDERKMVTFPSAVTVKLRVELKIGWEVA